MAEAVAAVLVLPGMAPEVPYTAAAVGVAEVVLDLDLT